MEIENSKLNKLYGKRWNYNETFDFPESIAAINRSRAWNNLVEQVFSKYVDPDFKILDLGSGPGYFINRIESKNKIAVDLDSENLNFLNSDVKFLNQDARDLKNIPNNSIDIIFSSNFFEHLNNFEDLFDILLECNRIIDKQNPNSKIIVLVPNILRVKFKFYDFIDHKLPLSPYSLSEALVACGFEIEEVIPKFFPYTALKNRFKIPNILFKMYLRLPFWLRLNAGQMLCTATPKSLK